MPCENCACGRDGASCGSTSRRSAKTGPSLPLSKPASSSTKAANAQDGKLWTTTAASLSRAFDDSRQASSSSSSSSLQKSYGAVTSAEQGALQSESTETTALLAPGGNGNAAPAKCEKHNGIRGVCCRDLKTNDERHLFSPDVVRDVIIGLSDGLTVPFALTAGLSGVGSSRIVVLAGLAELVSGAISMGVGGLLSAQAEITHYNYMCASTQRRVAMSCRGEMEREVCEILEPFGVPAEVAALVASKLQDVERHEDQSVTDHLPAPVTSMPPVRTDGFVGPQRGLTPFLIRIGEGLEKVDDSRAWQSAIVIGTSYFVGGFIPLLPYILLASVQCALFVSIVVTGIVLVIFGVVKQSCTGGANDARGLLWGAVSTLFVGAAAAGSSFAIVRALEA